SSATCSYDSSNFSGPSFTSAPSGSTFTGGADYIPPVYDSGTVSLTIGSFNTSTPYGANSTGALLASALATNLNNGTASPVTAAASGSTLNLTYRTAGAVGNISFSCTSATGDSQHFTGPSFTCPVTIAMSGGKDAVTNTIYDSGTINLAVGSYTASASYG